MFSRFIHIIKCLRILFFFRLNTILFYVYAEFSLPIHPSIDIWVVSIFGYCEKCCYDHWYTNICSSHCFQLLWVYFQNASLFLHKIQRPYLICPFPRKHTRPLWLLFLLIFFLLTLLCPQSSLSSCSSLVLLHQSACLWSWVPLP